ncbi:MAG TPA: ABC transporter substrate-binding protein [Actinomycetota bacterium]
MARPLGWKPLLLAALLAATCTGGGSANKHPTVAFRRGGTLRLGMVGDVSAPYAPLAHLDPVQEYSPIPFALYRCCLLRTLLSYEGRATSAGGAELRPDLAARLPDVSQDGLTWTFHLKRGLRYAPPFAHTEIVAGDIVRALDREARIAPDSGYPFYYSVIQGFDDFSRGRADSISGLQTPDSHTLLVHLTQPAGDLGGRLALAASAPVPAGATTGHDRDYGRFLVASGPYMIEGSDKLDFSKPPAEQRPVAGYEPRRFLTLVRNPSWHAATDALRPGYVDRIEIDLEGMNEQEAAEVDSGQLDIVFDTNSPPDQVRRYQAQAALRSRLFTDPYNLLFYVAMNLATPPFDDIHVRKAVNWIIDKEGLRRLVAQVKPEGFLSSLGPGEIAGHLVPDSLENDLLAGYDPFATPGHRGDLTRARAEMRQSRYDRNGDGVCDGSTCHGIYAVTRNDATFPQQAALIARDLRELGITLRTQSVDVGTMFTKIENPTNHVALALDPGWESDYLNASTFFEPLLYGGTLSESFTDNESKVGATPRLLAAWGYPVRTVPTIDTRVADCIRLVGEAQTQCWAGLDQFTMENVVPWVPYLEGTVVRAVSARVAHYSFDQFAGLPALDQIALKPGAD